MELLKHFKELTVRPKNAKELKGLILQLAIQGKLTANWRIENPNIEAASELLNRIQKEKEQLIKSKKIRTEKTLPDITKEEVSFEIPNSWVWCRMGDLFSMSTGKGYKKAEYSLSGIKLFQIANVSFGQTSWNTTIYLPDNYALKYPEEVIHKGDLVMALNRPLLKNKLKVAVLDINDGPSIIYQRVGKFNFHLNNMSNWMLNYLQSPFFIDWLSEQVRGINIPFVNQTKLYQHITVLPPLEEQKEIVKVVETLFKEVEQLEQLTVERIGLKEDFVTSALHQLTTNNANQEWTYLQDHFKSFFNETTNIKKLREAVLQLAVQGKLTQDWRANNPDTEDASQLLKSIQEEKAQLVKNKKIKKEKALPPIIKDEIPYELPEGWVWCRFGDLITFLNGYAFKSSTYVPLSAYQIIRLGNVKNDNFIVNTKEAYVPSSVGEVTLSYQLFEDDILTTLTGTKNRRDYCFTCLVKQEHLKQRVLLLNQRVGCIRAIDKSSSELLNKFLKSEIILNQLFETETGTANQGNIGSTSFKNLVFPLPPLEEQKAIVEKVNALMGLCDKLEQEVQQSQKHSEMMMKSVLCEVFEGERKTVEL